MADPALLGDVLTELGFLPLDADRAQALRVLRREVRDAGTTSVVD